MNNRTALALAVVGGYALGRTKKAKMALGLGGLVMGRRVKLAPQRLAGLLGEQLKANPQLAELRDEVRADLSGAGKAAAGALLTRRMDSIADSLHHRTQGLRDRLEGASPPGAGQNGEVAPEGSRRERSEEASPESARGQDGENRSHDRDGERAQGSPERAEGRKTAKKASGKPPSRTPGSGKPPTKRVGKETGGRVRAAQQTRARGKTPGRESGQAARPASRRSREGGGGDHD